MPEALADLSRLSLAEIEEAIASRKLPPVESWQPERVGQIDIRIARDGRWYHEGGEITRPNMVRLFSTILRREEDGRHVLVTPAEKLTIQVDDAAFVAVEVNSEGEGRARRLAFRLNTGDLVIAGAKNRLISRGTVDEPAHFLAVRAGLEARIGRSVYYELAEWALEERADPLGLWSNSEFFPL